MFVCEGACMPLHSCGSKKTTSGIGLYLPPCFSADSLFSFATILHVPGYLVYQLGLSCLYLPSHHRSADITDVCHCLSKWFPGSGVHILMLRQHTLLSTEPYLILGRSLLLLFSLIQPTNCIFCKFCLVHLWLNKVYVYLLCINTKTQSHHLPSLSGTYQVVSILIPLTSLSWSHKQFSQLLERSVNSLWPLFKSPHWVLIVVSLKTLSLK